MCMEDVKIGRETMGGQTDLTASLTSQPLLPGADDRYSIVFTAPVAGHVTYSLANPAILGNGINLGVGDGTSQLDIQHHGDLVRRQWFCIADQASAPISVLWTLLKRQ